MLTAKVGESIVNCIDGKYDRYRLKQWSNKGILKCPVCNGDYKYCHGEIVSPYFRHVGKECDGYYSEPETDEHRNGKLMIYNWILNQKGISNSRLEAWIPETRQRPDVYFEYDGKKFVIEYQCTPIASEFLIRRELYKLAGINDIWILGVDKYNIEIDKSGDVTHHNRFKNIEVENMKNGILYLDTNRKTFLLHSGFLEQKHYLLQSVKDNISKKDYYRRNCKVFNNLSYDKEYFTIERYSNFKFDGDIKLEEDIVNMFQLLEMNLSKMWAEKLYKDEQLRKKERIFDEKIEKLKQSSKYVGEVGENFETQAQIIKYRSFMGWYGLKYLVEVIDKNNNVYV